MIDIGSVKSYLQDHSLDGWLLYDFQQLNPIFWEALGRSAHVTRPCWFFIPAHGDPVLIAHKVDTGKFSDLGLKTSVYSGRRDMQHHLGEILRVGQTVAMEYSPLAALPVISRVDAGTVELVKSLGAAVVSSADVVQHAIGRLDKAQADSQASAARQLGTIVNEAFQFIRGNLSSGVTEHDVCEFIRLRFVAEHLITDSGPIVAVNEHSGDPHYEPTPGTSQQIRPGDWILIDLWAKEEQENAVFGDITWVAFAGDEVPEAHRKAFDIVKNARNLALDFIQEAFRRGEFSQGWQVDERARDFIASSGYGAYFTHRLGHSLGKTVHSYAVNLDSFETRDTRRISPGIAFTIEPGVYMPEFGVRSEINVFMSDQGPAVTSPVQEEVVLIAS